MLQTVGRVKYSFYIEEVNNNTFGEDLTNITYSLCVGFDITMISLKLSRWKFTSQFKYSTQSICWLGSWVNLSELPWFGNKSYCLSPKQLSTLEKIEIAFRCKRHATTGSPWDADSFSPPFVTLGLTSSKSVIRNMVPSVARGGRVNTNLSSKGQRDQDHGRGFVLSVVAYGVIQLWVTD